MAPRTSTLPWAMLYILLACLALANAAPPARGGSNSRPGTNAKTNKQKKRPEGVDIVDHRHKVEASENAKEFFELPKDSLDEPDLSACVAWVSLVDHCGYPKKTCRCVSGQYRDVPDRWNKLAAACVPQMDVSCKMQQHKKWCLYRDLAFNFAASCYDDGTVWFDKKAVGRTG